MFCQRDSVSGYLDFKTSSLAFQSPFYTLFFFLLLISSSHMASFVSYAPSSRMLFSNTKTSLVVNSLRVLYIVYTLIISTFLAASQTLQSHVQSPAQQDQSNLYCQRNRSTSELFPSKHALPTAFSNKTGGPVSLLKSLGLFLALFPAL